MRMATPARARGDVVAGEEWKEGRAGGDGDDIGGAGGGVEVLVEPWLAGSKVEVATPA